MPPGQHQAQQAHHRDAFIDEEAHVALRLGQHERLLQSVQRLARLALRTLGQRGEDQDLQLAAQPPLRPGMGAEAVEEPQGFLWLALGEQHACQGECAGLLLIGGRRLVRVGPPFAPARHRLHLSLGQPPAHLGGLGLDQEPCVPLLLGQGHGLREQGTRRILLPPCLSDAGLHDRGQAEHASPQQGTAHKRGGLGEGACQLRLCHLEGVPFIEERSLPDGGFDGVFAAFGRALPHLLIALGGLVELALQGQHIAEQHGVDQQPIHVARPLMQRACLHQRLPGRLRLAHEPVAATYDARAHTAHEQLPRRQER